MRTSDSLEEAGKSQGDKIKFTGKEKEAEQLVNLALHWDFSRETAGTGGRMP